MYHGSSTNLKEFTRYGSATLRYTMNSTVVTEEEECHLSRKST